MRRSTWLAIALAVAWLQLSTACGGNTGTDGGTDGGGDAAPDVRLDQGLDAPPDLVRPDVGGGDADGPGPGDGGTDLTGDPSSDGGPDAGDGGPTEVSLLSAADWVAAQVGDGPWQRLQPTGAGTDEYRISVPAGERYAFAQLIQSGQASSVSLIMATPEEATRWRGAPRLTVHQVSGQVENIGVDLADISTYSDFQLNLTSASPGYVLDTVIEGTRDFIVRRLGVTGDVTALRIVRDVEVAGDLTNQNIDLGEQTVSTTAHALNVTGGSAFVQFVTRNASATVLGDSTTGASWFALDPKSSVGPVEGDNYHFFAVDDDGQVAITRTVDATTDPGDQTLDLDALARLESAIIGITLPPTFTDLSYTPAAGSPPLRSFLLEVNQSGPGVSWTGVVTVGYLGGETSLTWPSLDGVEGFDSDANLQSLQGGTFRIQAIAHNVEISVLADALELNTIRNLVLHSATRQGKVTFQ